MNGQGWTVTIYDAIYDGHDFYEVMIDIQYSVCYILYKAYISNDRIWIYYFIYSIYENRSFLKSMLLNHTKTIAKAGGRKAVLTFLFWLHEGGREMGEVTREAKVQRNYKDTVSRMLFREPENALSLYNALNRK